MNKAELIDAVADGADISKADATRAVDAVVDQITSALKKGDQVTLVGFGTFAVKDRAALSMHTVRSTLKQVFAKTETRRQAELVRLLLTTSAGDPALNLNRNTGS